MVKFRSLLLVILTALSFAFCSCERVKSSIGCKISYKIHYILHADLPDGDLAPGDILAIENVVITPTEPKSGVKIKHVDFFLGNKLIGASQGDNPSLFYTIPKDMAPGNYVMHMDFYLTASSDKYLDTRITVTQAIEIVNAPNN